MVQVFKLLAWSPKTFFGMSYLSQSLIGSIFWNDFGKTFKMILPHSPCQWSRSWSWTAATPII